MLGLAKPDTCRKCFGWNWGCDGFVPADGSGDNGCLVILEAAGEAEAAIGRPTVGPAGSFLWNQLHRVGIERDGFRIHNVLSCRPPNNFLAKAPYEANVIASCSPLLDATIAEHAKHARAIGKTPTIISLGKISFKRLLGVTDRDAIMRESTIGYPFWSEKYQSWIISAPHPSHIMQGKQLLIPVLQYIFQRALEIADKGIVLDKLYYIEDPEPVQFEQWIQDYFYYVDHDPDVVLSYDIETAYKSGKSEEDLARAEDESGILRCSFAYRVGHAVSVPWTANYLPMLQEIFAYTGAKVGWNSMAFDAPKIKEVLPINGDEIDAMLAWHVLNTAMPKGLGFVTPFYAQSFPMWKHLSRERPAYYNAADADAALRCWLGIKEDLKRNGLWHVFDRHVTQVHRVFKFMSDRGVVLDQEMRAEAEQRLSGLLAETEEKITAAIPVEAKRKKIYKKAPKDTTGMVQVEGTALVKRCSICDIVAPKKAHFKPVSAKKAKLGLDNCCEDAEVIVKNEKVMLWARLLDFKISKLGMTNYQKVTKHAPIWNRREHKTTFDESAIMRLVKKYPNDKLYPLIPEYRGLQKLLSTYIGVTQLGGAIRGGMPIGPDGRVHTQFTSNPSTLRSASQNPNLQNLPRPTTELAKIIRNLIIASPGNILYARDFSGIEAVLVGYDASAPGYIRLARRDVHTYYTAWALNELEPGRITGNDLPLLSWSDEKLFSHLEGLKALLKKERNSLYKHLVHAANYAQTAKGAKEKIYVETGMEFPVELVQRVMDIYFALFPEIKTWHITTLLQAEKDGYLRNAFGYLHRFLHVFNYEKIDGRWEKKINPDVGNKVIAFRPQSNAAGIIKEAMLLLHEGHFEAAGQWLRLLVHDELFFDCPIGALDNLDKVVQNVMELPIKQMPLPESYGLGPYLSILTEAKQGERWGSLK